MKTLILTENNLSKHIFNDDVSVEITEAHVKTPMYIIGDLNSNNCVLVESVTPPEDWDNNKYFYENQEWISNPEYISLRDSEIQHLTERIEYMQQQLQELQNN